MFYIFASAGVILFLDQWSKRAVQNRVADHGISWGPFLRVKCTTNLKQFYRRNDAVAVLVLVWLLALVSAIILHRSGAWFQTQAALVGLGLAFGGAAGNLLDVVQYRYIVDFVDLRWWPVFNLADVGIVGGLLLAFCR